MLYALFLSHIRMYVPLAVGAALTWAGAKFGIVLDQDTSAALAVGVTGAAAAVYYTAARLLETKWPKLGVLLGVPVAPTYGHRARSATPRADDTFRPE